MVAFVDRNITFAEMEALIGELVKKYKDDHKVDEDAAKQQIAQKLTKTKPKTHGTTVSRLFNQCDVGLLYVRDCIAIGLRHGHGLHCGVSA